LVLERCVAVRAKSRDFPAQNGFFRHQTPQIGCRTRISSRKRQPALVELTGIHKNCGNPTSHRRNEMKVTATQRLRKWFDFELLRDIFLLYVAACFVLVQLFGYSISGAALVSPLVIGALLLGLMLVIQTLWYLMVGIDRLLSYLNLDRGSHF
jgi:hypothetical protein